MRDAALAEMLFKQLQEDFRQDACFWQQSGYNNPGHPFFSFLYELVQGSSRRLFSFSWPVCVLKVHLTGLLDPEEWRSELPQLALCCLMTVPARLLPENHHLQGDPAVGAIEVAIQCCKERLSQSGYDMSTIKAAEWWAHKRAATDAHQLHFDLDETRIGSGPAKYKLRHPVSVDAVPSPHLWQGCFLCQTF